MITFNNGDIIKIKESSSSEARGTIGRIIDVLRVYDVYWVEIPVCSFPVVIRSDDIHEKYTST